MMIPHSHGHSDSFMQPVETSSNMGSSTCPCSYCVTAHHLTALSLCIPEAGPRSLYEQSCDQDSGHNSRFKALSTMLFITVATIAIYIYIELNRVHYRQNIIDPFYIRKQYTKIMAGSERVAIGTLTNIHWLLQELLPQQMTPTQLVDAHQANRRVPQSEPLGLICWDKVIFACMAIFPATHPIIQFQPMQLCLSSKITESIKKNLLTLLLHIIGLQYGP